MFEPRPYAPIGDSDAAAYRDEAALGLIEAQLACLHHRRRTAMDSAAALDLACQIRDALASRRALLQARGGSPNAA
jgi:hypothetical protein